MLQDIWWLLIAYQVKHFLCDYPLQTTYMLGKFKAGGDFILPLTAHCGVHALGTLVISAVYLSTQNLMSLRVLFLVCSFDFVLHFIMDRVKADPTLLGRFHPLSPAEYYDLIKFEEEKGSDAQTEEDKRHNKYFWWCLGLDQKFHHLTHYAIIFYLVGLN